jgi:peptide/nickel transport system ATP-binding protein
MVFQGAMNGLNPVLTIGSQIADAVKAHDRHGSRRSRRERAGQLLDMVGVGASLLGSYSHQLSGGMRQRVMLAMALALDPDVVLMDEPTTALDVVVQRELLDQIRALQDRLGFAVLFITHDLSLLLDVADRVSIMYGGRIVEEASAAQLAADPAHPYSEALLNSFPLIHDSRRSLAGIPGAPPALDSMPAGCPFHPRCPRAGSECRAQVPALAPYRAGDGARRAVACWHPADSRRPAAGRPEATR